MAAKYRMMTQPALSQHLANLEAEVGEPLFRRAPRRMIPTEKGKYLYNQVVRAVDQLEQVNSHLMQAELPPVVRIGAPQEYFHERIATRWAREDMDLEVIFGLSKPLLEMLQRGDLDVVIATQHIATSGLVYTKYMTETFLLVGDPSHKQKMQERDGEDAAKQLESFRWISYATDLPIIRRYWFEAFHVRPALRPSYVVPDLRIIKDMVINGLGVSVLPDYLVSSELSDGTLCQLWSTPHKAANDLWLVSRSSDQEDETIQSVLQTIMQL